MRRDAGDHRRGPAGPPVARVLARGEDWCISEQICRAGPQDRPFEERHERVTIAAVVAGSFRYRSEAGDGLLYPGALLLGNAGTCFECGHDHSAGDRCIAFHFDPEVFAEIAAAVTGSHRFRFTAAMLPAVPALIPSLVALEVWAAQAGRAEEEVIRLAEKVLAAMGNAANRSVTPTPREQRRIGAALRHIEEHAEEQLGLAELAAAAAMSKYHFLRSFRRIAGVTPYELLLATRMRRAAVKLSTTPLPVSTIAFEAGFGDLSTFNRRFRTLFGLSPRAYRRRGTA